MERREVEKKRGAHLFFLSTILSARNRYKQNKIFPFMDPETIVLAIAGIFWSILIGARFFRYQVPQGERAEYDQSVKFFAYATAVLTIGSILFWLGDESWSKFLKFCLESGVIYIRVIFLSIFYILTFFILLFIWRRRVGQ